MSIFRDEQSPKRLLTIITVCRNDADRLAKTLGSLTNFYGDERYEHIVVDGESTDHTRDIVTPLLSLPNFHFSSGKDGGIYDAMNHGVDYGGSGQYLLFLNCGDCIQASPEEIAQCLSSLESSQGEAEIICFPFCQMGVGSYSRKVSPEAPRPHKLPTSHQGMLFSRKFVSAHPYDPKYRIAGDYDLYLRADFSRIVVLPTLFSLSRVEIDGVASGNPITAYREYLRSAYKNLNGRLRVLVLARIALRAIVVILLKRTLPPGWIAKLRGSI